MRHGKWNRRVQVPASAAAFTFYPFINASHGFICYILINSVLWMKVSPGGGFAAHFVLNTLEISLEKELFYVRYFRCVCVGGTRFYFLMFYCTIFFVLIIYAFFLFACTYFLGHNWRAYTCSWCNKTSGENPWALPRILPWKMPRVNFSWHVRPFSSRRPNGCPPPQKSIPWFAVSSDDFSLHECILGQL